MILCKICGAESKYFANAILLTKYDVKYFQCSHCGFVQTEEPFWLDEAYSKAISAVDTGIVKRNLELAEVTQTLIRYFFSNENSFLDYGAGYGLFVRLMRDKGFNFFWFDKFAENLFGKTFESDEKIKYNLLTAFEVFEHLVDPSNEIKEILQKGNSIFFSTTLLPKSNPRPHEWWYYSTFAGQHVSIYTKKSLEILAEQNGLNLVSNGKNLHLITSKKISSFWFNVLVNKKVSPLINLFQMKKSLIDSDFETISGTLKQKIK